jgi:hypothetical protein
VYQISYRRENTRRDRLYGKPVRGEVDTHELADKARSYRSIVRSKRSSFSFCSRRQLSVIFPDIVT